MATVRSLRTLALSLLLFASPLALLAADGRISGTVKRTDGRPIAGVIVQAIGTSNAVLSDSTGAFLLDGLAPGTYTLSFSAGEHASNETVEVRSNETSRVDKVVDWRISIAETITVTSASRRAERIVEAPSAISVAAEETIAAAAPTGQAPRIIENAPGVDFTQSGLYDFNFNTRGFNSSLNRRILTLIDGRDPSVPFLGAQEWAALSYPIDEMASVELIRGPGSALYGANAFSGVLNMTTKAPRNSPGGRLMLTGGDLNTRRADARHAGEIGGGWYYRLTGGFQQSDDYTISRVGGAEYADPDGVRPPAELAPLALNEVQTAFGGIRFDKHFEASGNVLTAEGGYAELEGPTFVTGIGRVQVVDVAHPWARLNYNMRHFNGLAYYDARQADQQVALSSGAPLTEDSYNLHGELQTNWEFFQNALRLVGGVAYNQQEVDTNGTLMAQVVDEDSQAAFGQVTWDVTPKLALVAAARYDDSNLYDTQISPKGAIVFSITPMHTVRYGYNEAFQRPNYSELFLRAAAGAPVNLAAAAAANPAAAPLAPALTQLGFNSVAILARGNSALDVEKVKSHEVGYSGIFGGKVYLTADYYQSQLSNFVTDLLPGVNQAQFPAYEIPASLPAPIRAGLANFLEQALKANKPGLTTVNGRPALVLSYANAGEVDTQGLELGLNYYVTNNWLVDANYAWFDFEVKDQLAGDALLPNSPENKYNLGISYRGGSFDARIGYRWVEEFPWAAGIFKGIVPEYDVVNLSAQYRLNNFVGFGVDVTNLLDDVHYEAFGGDLLERRALGFVTLNW
jgi:outer membrane receptor for ferrienterochelin and colicins